MPRIIFYLIITAVSVSYVLLNVAKVIYYNLTTRMVIEKNESLHDTWAEAEENIRKHENSEKDTSE